MTATVNIATLKLRLLDVKDESAKFKKGNLPKEIHTAGAKYLYRKMLLPVISEKRVKLSQLNMDSFDLDDISIIYDYYGDNYESGTNERSKLRKFYCNFKERTPMNSAVDFI